MADSITKEQRSKNMAKVKGKDTKSEIAVRKFLHSQGIGYRLHCKELPGKPDAVMRRRNAVIFVNGCYWHRHEGCKLAYTPKSNTEFWEAKFKDNVERDRKNHENLTGMGWKVITVWECEVRNNSFTKWIINRIEE